MPKFLLAAIAAAAVAWSQTAINAPSVKCPGLAAGQLGVLISAPPPLFMACVQLDLARFTLDKSTTPPTLRMNQSAAAAVMVREVPAGVVDGVNANFTLSAVPVAGLPVLVFRNGLLLTPCISTGCNGDYQQGATALLFLAAAQTAGGVSAVPLSGDLLQVVYWRAGA